MDPTAYKEGLEAVHMMRGMAEQVAVMHDLDAMLQAIKLADSAGAVLDPTAYMQQREAMEQDRETVKAVRALARLAPAGEETK